MMFGYATSATPSPMPAPIHYSHRLLEHPQNIRKEEVSEHLHPDAKIQVAVLHENGRPVRKKVYRLAKELDEEVARFHIERLDARLTKLSAEPADYISIPQIGPFMPEHYRY